MQFKSFAFLLLFTAFFVISNVSVALSQQARVNAFSIERSDLIEKLKQKKTENPKITATELVDYGNDLLFKSGFNYEFGLAPKICKIIADKKAKAKPEQGNAVGITAKFNQEQGEPVAVKFSDVVTEIDGCGACALEVPLVAVTSKDFVTIVLGRNIKFQLSPDIILERVELVDNQNLKAVIRSWQIPFQAVPIGISKDGTSLILDLPTGEVNELALQIFDNGVLQLAAKKDLNLSEKPNSLKDFPKDPNNAYLSYITFGTGATKKTLKFSAPCS